MYAHLCAHAHSHIQPDAMSNDFRQRLYEQLIANHQAEREAQRMGTSFAAPSASANTRSAEEFLALTCFGIYQVLFTKMIFMNVSLCGLVHSLMCLIAKQRVDRLLFLTIPAQGGLALATQSRGPVLGNVNLCLLMLSSYAGHCLPHFCLGCRSVARPQQADPGSASTGGNKRTLCTGHKPVTRVHPHSGVSLVKLLERGAHQIRNCTAHVWFRSSESHQACRKV